ncbi:collagen alpha-3(VI) chain-like [Thalassophryne amazonica]|uniref:collagen alpha-3(VI) chain-like n=1 Tax=Thalassophryne amazonica TaxID=390379 RepID=UPI0014715E10|nr:collagen alpha-3(VI) chain-like [Thalassophryne amazonica]
MRDFVQRIVKTMSVDDNRDRVSVVQYSRDPSVHFYLNTYTTKAEILNTVRGLRHKGGRPLNTGAALQYLRDNVFTAPAGSRSLKGVPQVLILLNGGRSFDSVDAPASALKQMGVLIYPIGNRGSDSRELQKISHDPRSAVTVTEFTDLPSVQQQIESSLGVVVTDIIPEPTTVFVQPDMVKKDIVFLLDGSDGTRNGFPAMRDLVERVVEKVNVGENHDRVSVVQYSRDTEVHFYLNTYKTREDVVDSVRGLQHRGGRPLNTGAALQYPSALKQQGIFAVGIGTRTSDSRELQKISYDPTYALLVSEFNDLPDVQEQLFSVLSTMPARVTPMPPTVIERWSSKRPHVRDLALKIIEPLDVGRDTIRVALVLYSTDPDIKFYLNSYDTKADILDAVKGLTFTGGDESNLGAALEEVASSLLGQTAGGRAEEGVPQVLVVISAGPSTDDIGFGDRALKRAGVLTFSMAIGDTAAADLEVVATDTSFFLSATDFRSLGSMSVQILPYIIGVAQRTIIVQTEFKEALAIGKRDIIFLIDSTMGATLIGSVREFIKRFVDNMPIAPDQVQVGIATFSDTARIEMDLNTHGSRESLTAALGRIKPKQAQTINIGAALDFVRLIWCALKRAVVFNREYPKL